MRPTPFFGEFFTVSGRYRGGNRLASALQNPFAMTGEAMPFTTDRLGGLFNIELTHVRELTKQDAESLRELRLQALIESGESFRSSYEEERRRSTDDFEDMLKRGEGEPGRGILGAFRDEELVGMIGFNRAEEVQARHKAHVWGVYVVPAHRWQGIGRNLLNEAVARLRRLPGLEQIHLSVMTNNVGGRSLFTKLGFEPYGIERRAMKHRGRYFDEAHMVRWLVDLR
jgi:RimJ/RimL family protein N-acetyltransferase